MGDIDYKVLFTELGHQMIRATSLRFLNTTDTEFYMGIGEDSDEYRYKIEISHKDMKLVVSQRSKPDYSDAYYNTKPDFYEIQSFSLADPQFDDKWKAYLKEIRQHIKESLPRELQSLQTEKQRIAKKTDIIKRMIKRIK